MAILRAVPDLPASIDGHRVLARIASGGMAEIFLARQQAIGGFEREIVIKRLLPHYATDPDVAGTLLDEARILARLRHPNVVAIHAAGEDGGIPYLALEHLRGASLSAIAKSARELGRPLDPSIAAHVVAELCAGLDAVHALRDGTGLPMQVVHRDVSPHNVMLTLEGEVKLIDFGVAWARDRSSRTRSGIAKGKFAYMAPEQLSGEPLDGRTDVFAAGAVLHELLTGRRLFARDTEPQTLKALLHDPIPRPSEVAAERAIPRALDAICMRALARAPGRRFPTAAAMRDALAETIDRRFDARTEISALARAHAEGLDRRSHVSKETATLPEIPASIGQPQRHARIETTSIAIRASARRAWVAVAAAILVVAIAAGALGATLVHAPVVPTAGSAPR